MASIELFLCPVCSCLASVEAVGNQIVARPCACPADDFEEVAE
jgi:hypothetical protein